MYQCGHLALSKIMKVIIVHFGEAGVADGRHLGVASGGQRCPRVDHTARVDEDKELVEGDEACKDPCIIACQQPGGVSGILVEIKHPVEWRRCRPSPAHRTGRRTKTRASDFDELLVRPPIGKLGAPATPEYSGRKKLSAINLVQISSNSGSGKDTC